MTFIPKAIKMKIRTGIAPFKFFQGKAGFFKAVTSAYFDLNILCFYLHKQKNPGIR